MDSPHPQEPVGQRSTGRAAGWPRGTVRTLVVVFLAFLGTCGSCGAVVVWVGMPPSEKSLTERFQKTRPILEQLVQMSHRDGVRHYCWHWDPETPQPEGPKTPALVAEYTTLLKKADLKCLHTWHENRIAFEVWGFGIGSETARGFIWHEDELENVVTCLDHPGCWPSQLKRGASVYKPLDEHWALFAW